MLVGAFLDSYADPLCMNLLQVTPATALYAAPSRFNLFCVGGKMGPRKKKVRWVMSDSEVVKL